MVLVGAKRDRSPRCYPKSCTHHFKIAERRGELFELENGGPDEAARAPARAAASPRYAQNADGDAAVAVAEQQELSAFQLGQLEPLRRQQSAVRRRLGQHRHRYTIFSFISPSTHPLPPTMVRGPERKKRLLLDDPQTNCGNTKHRYRSHERANSAKDTRKRMVVSFAERIAHKMTDHRHVICTITTKNRRRCAKVVERYDERINRTSHMALMVRACFRFWCPRGY